MLHVALCSHLSKGKAEGVRVKLRVRVVIRARDRVRVRVRGECTPARLPGGQLG